LGGSKAKPIVDEEVELPRTTNIIKEDNTPIVLLFRFIGTQYHGLQQNLDVHTVEKELIAAMIKSGILNEDAHYTNVTRLFWRVASRTDTGVHACANVVSLKATNTEGLCVGDVPKMINDELPKTSTIRVLACLSFSRRFDAQKYAGARNYQYLLPLHTLKSSSKDHLDYLRNDIMPLFIGTLNYHNFTRDCKATDRKAMRTIDIFTFSDPFDVDGVECVLITIHGIAFMLNQIRKMVSLVVAASYGQVGPEEVKRCFSEEDWNIKMIIGDGLFLDKVEYPNFNRSTNRNPLTIETDVEFAHFRPEIERWKRDVLFRHIVRLDKEKNRFRNWVNDKLLKYKVTTREALRIKYEEIRREMEEADK
jgi:tRNA pseudouridine38-40 synthase